MRFDGLSTANVVGYELLRTLSIVSDERPPTVGSARLELFPTFVDVSHGVLSTASVVGYKQSQPPAP